MTERIRLLIADDHPIVRAGLRDMLASQPDFEVVGEASTGVEAVELADRLQPRVVLMDMRMPELDGVGATARIKAKHPDTYVLFITTQDAGADILSAIETGATGYLLKDTPREELFEAVRTAAQGKPLLAPAVTARLMERIRDPSERTLGGGETEEPTLQDRGASDREIGDRKRATAPPTGTVTFLFTDIEGSTSLWEKYPQQMRLALARHDEILRTHIEASGGYVFKTVGDAYCAAFTTAKEAFQATLAAQRALFDEQWSENTELRARMALHTGAAEEREGDYFGPPLNRVARLLSAGHGGQVLLSAVTYGLVRDDLEPGMELRHLGEHRLKDLRYTERIFQLVAPDLPSEFPALRTLDTHSDERYRLKKLIGSGGMAEVYLAHDQELDRDVAFKVLRKPYSEDERFAERFRLEARSAASLSHPNIVGIFDRGRTKDGSYYIVMEYVSGGTLKEHIEKEGPLAADRAIAIALQVAQALQVAHERGVIHRDIKPQNILLTESGEVKVADFGIARAAASPTTLTQTGMMMGTLQYLAPEQAHGLPASRRSDLYALGVVFGEMLTGGVPYDIENLVEAATGRLGAPGGVDPEVGEGLNAVCARLLARDPEDRYQEATELIEDLERLQRSESPAFVAQPEATGTMITSPSAGADNGDSAREQLDTSEVSPSPAGSEEKRVVLRRRVPPWVLTTGLVIAVTFLAVGIIVWFIMLYSY